MTSNDFSGTGNPDVVGPNETNTPSSAPAVASVKSRVKTTLISLGQDICPSSVNASPGRQMMLLNTNEFKSIIRLLKPLQRRAPGRDIGSDDPKWAFARITAMGNPLHNDRQLPTPTNDICCTVRNRNAPPVGTRPMPVLSWSTATAGVSIATPTTHTVDACHLLA